MGRSERFPHPFHEPEETAMNMEAQETCRKRFNVGPGTCLMAGMFFVVLGFLNATTFTKLRPVLDAAGKQVLRDDGTPRMETDQWATFWNGWSTNVPMMLAVVLFVVAVVKCVVAARRHVRAWRR